MIMLSTKFDLSPTVPDRFVIQRAENYLLFVVAAYDARTHIHSPMPVVGSGNSTFTESPARRRLPRAKYEQALNVSKQINAKQMAAAAELGLADIAIEQEDPADAESPCRHAIAEFRAEKDAPDEIIGARDPCAGTIGDG
jgi:hypothetical protein